MPVMSIQTLSTFIALTLSFSTLWASPTEKMQSSGEAHIGTTIPRLVGYPLGSAQPFTTDSYFGKAVNHPKGIAYVVFATWCKPCVKGISELTTHALKLKNAGIQVVLLNMQEESDVVGPWTQAQKIPASFLVILDEWGTEAKKLGVKKNDGTAKLPLTVVTDGQGTVKAIFGKEGPDYLKLIFDSVK